MAILKDLLYKCGLIELHGNNEVPVDSITFDSRNAGPGCLFIATPGTKTDGHRFIPEVISNGCKAVVCQSLPVNQDPSVTYAVVRDSRYALGIIAGNFYNNPSQRLELVGVTGTNGKTTTTTLLYELFTSLGYSCGLISTVQNIINGEVLPSTHTTPDAIKLNKLLASMADAGCTHCFMEVSSHALAQQRTAGLRFAGAVFTNITHDHLDYHKTFSHYLNSKKLLFDSLPEKSFALYNNDDKNGKVMLQNTKAKKYSYSLKTLADFKGRVIENNLEGLIMNIDGKEVHCKLIGRFNAYNLLAAYGTACLMGKDKLNVLTQISTISPVEGRFEYLVSGKKITGVIDYAHTPDALENVLKTIHDVAQEGKVITIVGCGGDRDAAKRPLMAGIAAGLSDKVILTSDNPRSEDPAEIIRQMEKGIKAEESRKALSIVDRKEAIKTAVSIAQAGDIILIAGKGHEKYQEVNGIKTPFDDKEVLREMFQLFS